MKKNMIMPKYRLEILPPAWAELDEIASFHLQAVGVNSARNITDKILTALSRLEDFPLVCPYVPDDELRAQDYRMLVCGKYLCIYRLVGDCVFVYHIVAGARKYPKLFTVNKDGNGTPPVTIP